MPKKRNLEDYQQPDMLKDGYALLSIFLLGLLIYMVVLTQFAYFFYPIKFYAWLFALLTGLIGVWGLIKQEHFISIGCWFINALLIYYMYTVTLITVIV